MMSLRSLQVSPKRYYRHFRRDAPMRGSCQMLRFRLPSRVPKTLRSCIVHRTALNHTFGVYAYTRRLRGALGLYVYMIYRIQYIYLSIHLSIYLSVYLSIYLCIYLSIHLSIHRSIYLIYIITFIFSFPHWLPFTAS